MKLPIDCIMSWDGNKITDHGRDSLNVSTEQIKNESRMVDGTLRRYVVASKRTWSTGWDNLFSKDELVADGFWAGESMLDFYQNTPGAYTMTLTMGDGTTENIPVMFNKFEYRVVKRTNGPLGDLWTVDCEIVEI